MYQDERPFLSARKVMYEMGEPYRSGVEIVSFHTVSKVSRPSTVQWAEGAIHVGACSVSHPGSESLGSHAALMQDVGVMLHGC